MEGVQGETIIIGHRATFYYDTRNNLISPTDGMAVTAYAEVNQNLSNSDSPVFSRYELEVKKLFPSESKRAILIIRADLQATLGSQVPFFEQSSLGGQNNLRGYGVDRFIDKHLIAPAWKSVFISSERRSPAWRLILKWRPSWTRVRCLTILRMSVSRITA